MDNKKIIFGVIGVALILGIALASNPEFFKGDLFGGRGSANCENLKNSCRRGDAAACSQYERICLRGRARVASPLATPPRVASPLATPPASRPVTPPASSASTPPYCPPVASFVRRSDLSLLFVEAFNLPPVPERERVILPDVPRDAFAYDAIQRVIAAGIMSVDPDNNFHPDRVPTRAEFARMVSYAVDPMASIPRELPRETIPRFTDVPEGVWYQSYIWHLYGTGVIRVSFRPSDPLDRAFAEEILRNATE